MSGTGNQSPSELMTVADLVARLNNKNPKAVVYIQIPEYTVESIEPIRRITEKENTVSGDAILILGS